MADRQESLFGRGEQLAQLNRLELPAGLKAPDGVGVRANVLKGVLRVIDDADRNGANGMGCTLTIETIAARACISARTAERALDVLAGLGLLTRERRQVGLRPVVERRICWGAVRAWNAGERPVDPEASTAKGDRRADEGDSRADEGDSRADGGDRRARRTKRIQAQGSAKIQSARGDGFLRMWKGRRLDAGELLDDERLAGLFGEAVAAGVVKDCESDRLAFVAWGLYCRREGRNPAGLFLSGLGRGEDAFGRLWRAKPTQADEERARRILRKLDGLDRVPEETAARASAESPAARVRRLYRDADRTGLLRAARLRLGRGSDAYRDFAAAVAAADVEGGGGVLDDVDDELLLRVFSGKGRSDADEGGEAGSDAARGPAVCGALRRDSLSVRRGALGLVRERLPAVPASAAEAGGEGLS